MLDHWKPLGGFIENTIRPMIEEGRWFLTELDRQGLKITEDNILKVADKIAKIHLRTVLIETFKSIFIAILIAFVLCKTFQSASP